MYKVFTWAFRDAFCHILRNGLTIITWFSATGCGSHVTKQNGGADSKNYIFVDYFITSRFCTILYTSEHAHLKCLPSAIGLFSLHAFRIFSKLQGCELSKGATIHPQNTPKLASLKFGKYKKCMQRKPIAEGRCFKWACSDIYIRLYKSER